MRPSFIAALICAATSSSVLATSDANFCKAVNSIVAIARAQHPALEFCASYLNQPSGKIATITASQTVTVTSTQTCQPTPTATAAAMRKVARGSKDKPKPACLNRFTKPAQISSACNCLPLTSTVTPTSTVRVAVTPPSFRLKASGSPADGQFMRIRGLFSTFDVTSAEGQIVRLNNTGGLYATIASAANDGSTYEARAIHDCGGNEAAAWYEPPGFACDNDWICRVQARADQTCNLACEGRSGWVNNQVQSAGGLVNQWYLSPSQASAGNTRVLFTPRVVPV